MLRKRKGNAMKTEILQVGGMTCGHCSARVEEALKGLEGVASAKVDLEGGQATVEYDEGKVQRAAMVKAVEDAGYHVGEGGPAGEEPKKKGFFRRG